MKKTLIAFLTTFITIVSFNYAHAQFEVGLDTMFAPASNLPKAGETGILSTFLGPLLSMVPIFTGIFSFIILIIAGIRYISHASNAQEAKKTNDMITYAIVGLIVSAAAFWITRVLFAVGGAQGLF